MNNWCRLKDMYCSEATINGYCPTALCKYTDKYSIDYSANHIVNTVTGTGTKYVNTTTDGKDHPDYGFPFHCIPENEPIVITQDAVFIKPLKLVVLTEDVYNKLKEK